MCIGHNAQFMRNRLVIIVVLWSLSLITWAVKHDKTPTLIFQGMSDASGAVPLGTNYFAVVDDETNPIRVYRRDAGGAPVASISLDQIMGTTSKTGESDFEAGTILDDLVFWVSSHGANKDGKYRPDRHRLFATKVVAAGKVPVLEVVGKPYPFLVEDLAQAPQLEKYHLGDAARLAPKSEGALNIEGLCSTPDGRLLIGFRNPIPDGNTLLVPLLNPRRVIEGERARLGDPILLDLEGLGIRDIARWKDRYYMVAGSNAQGGEFRLYEWDGTNATPRLLSKLQEKGFTAEALVLFPDKGTNEMLLLSDDGTRRVHNMVNKELPLEQRTFRGVWFKP